MQTADAGKWTMEFDWGAIVGAIVALTVAAGATTRWLVSRQDKMHDRDQEQSRVAHAHLESKVNEKLISLRSQFEAQLESQNQEVRFLKSELHRYIKHVGVLEGILKSHEIDIPAIEPPVLHNHHR